MARVPAYSGNKGGGVTHNPLNGLAARSLQVGYNSEWEKKGMGRGLDLNGLRGATSGFAAPWTTVALFAVALLASGCSEESVPDPEPIVTTGALPDVLYEPARRIVSRSCADCHAAGGKNEKHMDAWGHALRLDSWEEWDNSRADLQVRLDPVKAAEQDPPEDVMPLATFPFQLTPAERDTLLQWIARGSPNTVTGE